MLFQRFNTIQAKNETGANIDICPPMSNDIASVFVWLSLQIEYL